MRSRRRCRVLVSTGAAAVLLAASLTACGEHAKFVAAEHSVASIALTPGADDSKVPISAEVGLAVTDGQVSEVTVTTQDGDAVPGRLRADGSSWIPDKPLAYGTGYTASVTAVDAKEIPTTATTTFTTMAKPKKWQTATLWNEADYQYGQAAPVMINFDDEYEVPKKYRAAVERRLFVDSEPEQPGVWHWFSGSHVEYRPKDYWKPGTTITVRAALKGVPMGGGKYGAKDIDRTVHIDKDERIIKISNKSKKMVAKKNGKTLRSMPISLGKPGKPSYSGTMIIMERHSNIMFDTTAQCGGRVSGDDCYRTPVDWAERLTWSGQFIHSAPWSVGDQGYRNVSHGCVNASPADAEWVYRFVRVGDPVVIKGTEEHLPYGDGYTAYDLSWDDFKAGSALASGQPQTDNADDQD